MPLTNLRLKVIPVCNPIKPVIRPNSELVSFAITLYPDHDAFKTVQLKPNSLVLVDAKPPLFSSDTFPEKTAVMLSLKTKLLFERPPITPSLTTASRPYYPECQSQTIRPHHNPFCLNSST